MYRGSFGAGGGTHPPLTKSRPPLEIASLQSASHVHRAWPPPLFHKYSFRPPLDQFLNEGLMYTVNPVIYEAKKMM